MNLQLQYFKIEEFACHCGRSDCDAVPIDMAFALKLDGLRRELGLPIKLNSARRCKFHNTNIGGSSDSWHMKGCAVDIHCPNGWYRWRLIALAYKHGFTGLGIGKNFIHIDTRDGDPWCEVY